MTEVRMRGALVLLRQQFNDKLGILDKREPTGYHEVIACGPEVETVRPGDVVLCDKPGGTQVRFDGADLWVYRDDQMAAVAE